MQGQDGSANSAQYEAKSRWGYWASPVVVAPPLPASRGATSQPTTAGGPLRFLPASAAMRRPGGERGPDGSLISGNRHFVPAIRSPAANRHKRGPLASVQPCRSVAPSTPTPVQPFSHSLHCRTSCEIAPRRCCFRVNGQSGLVGRANPLTSKRRLTNSSGIYCRAAQRTPRRRLA